MCDMKKNLPYKVLTTKPEEFRAALQRATEEVASWPEWKRNIPVTAIPRRKR